MKKFNMAIIGVGGRGEGLYRVALKKRDYVNFVAVCDPNDKFLERITKEMVDDGRPCPAVYHDYKECIDQAKPDVVLVATSWEHHLPVSMYAMEKGIAVACEVGGAYSIESLWELVRCYERTKTPIMLMENCCYGRLELLALNMKRLGLLGNVVHCDGGYRHDLRNISKNLKHYRIWEYLHRNCENYPTHEIGPIAKLLDINCGNRFLSLVSVGSCSRGLEEYVQKHDLEQFKGARFCQSDIVSTIIKCANGETVSIALDTSLPRYYSRGFAVHGTKGLIMEENSSVYLEDDFPEEIWEWNDNYNNVNKYYEKYEHKRWEGYKPGKEGHGGMDYLVFSAFFEALDKGEEMPIDVYDMATWMAITTLSEQSIATGQAVAFPDFTDGKWVLRKNKFEL